MVTIAFEQHKLSNGMDVILHEDHTIPLVAVNVWYHVGSKNEEMGRTGFAHLFEHVMFEGTKHHQRSHFEPLQKAGANLNGSTTTDRTNYWEDVPSNYLELALWLEADRMGFLLDGLDQQKFDVQRDVVKNERRQSYENRPYGMAHHHLQSALFPLPHPYHWMTIGSQEDLDAASLDDVKGFFQRFYGPSNASLAVAGDFHPAEALDLVSRYFGDLPPGESVPRIGRQDSLLSGRVDIEMRDKVTLPRLYIAWPAPPEGHPDDAPLELYQAIMSDGLSSRLHRSLVYEKQIAQHAFVRYVPSEIAGQLLVQVTAAEGHGLDEIEAAVEAELENIHRNPPTDEEIARSKNRIEATHFRQLARIGGFGGRADQLNHFNVIESDANLINTSLDRCLAVQREDILRVAGTYVGDDRVRLRVLPETPLSAATTTVDRSIMPPPSREPTFTPPLPTRDRLPNGMGITVVEQRGMPIVAFGVLLGSGAAEDPADLPGLSGLVGDMLPEGAVGKSSQQIANDFEFIGARLSVDARREYSMVSTETLSKHWGNALEMMAEVLLSPDFPQHELDRVRREHLTDLRRSKDEPNAIAERLVPGLVYPSASGYAHPVSGTEASVSAITRDHLVSQFRRAYRPGRSHLLVVGDVDREEVMRRAAAVLGSWNGSASASVTVEDGELTHSPATVYLVDRPGAPQSVIRAMQPLVPRRHPRLLPIAAGQLFLRRTVLGSAEPEPASGQGLQLRLHVLDTVAAPALPAGRRRFGAEQRHRRVRLRNAEGVPRSLRRAAHHRRGTGQRQGRPAAGLSRQFRATRLRTGTAGRHGAVRPARRLLPQRPPVYRRRHPRRRPPGQPGTHPPRQPAGPRRRRPRQRGGAAVGAGPTPRPPDRRRRPRIGH